MYAACGGLRDKDHSLDGPKKSVCLILYDRDLLQSHSRGRTQGHFLRLHCVAYPSRTGSTYTPFLLGIETATIWGEPLWRVFLIWWLEKYFHLFLVRLVIDEAMVISVPGSLHWGGQFIERRNRHPLLKHNQSPRGAREGKKNYIEAEAYANILKMQLKAKESAVPGI